MGSGLVFLGTVLMAWPMECVSPAPQEILDDGPSHREPPTSSDSLQPLETGLKKESMDVPKRNTHS